LVVPSLQHWSFDDDCIATPLGSGLINHTFGIHDAAGRLLAVLQRLNTDIFDPRVHEDIEAVTVHLAARGQPTTRLVRTATDDLWHTDGEGGAWRVLTLIGDRTIDKLTEPADAESGGALVARFHAALADFSWDFRSVRPGAHDTDKHMDTLMRAVGDHRKHRLWWEVCHVAETIQEGWRTWDGPKDLPQRVIHGDLKISNLRFEGPDAVALIDLDTLQWGTLDTELGDAMRSWCNPAAEDTADTSFHIELFEAAMRGYATGAADHPPTPEEWSSIVPGVERICWELSARFAADALNECYFGWNPAFGTRGDHNLLRARGQMALAKSVRQQRSKAEAALGRARG